MSAEDVLRWAYSEFGERLCLTCSWQKQSSVLVHMVAELGLDVPVVELDTQLFFKETYETRERLVERYGLNLIRPHVLSVAEQRAHEPYDAWISGIRREQALTRKDAKRVEWSERYGVWKVQPLVDWDAKRVEAYVFVNE